MELRGNRSASFGGRPYRSHSHPACFPCRKRKSRCQTKDPAQGCIMCQVHGTDCTFPGIHAIPSQRSARSPSASPSTGAAVPSHRTPSSTRFPTLPPECSRRRAELPGSSNADRENEGRLPSNWGGIIADAGDKSSHVVSPAIASDSEVLESYLTTAPESSGGRRLIRSCPGRPVLFSTTPKRPVGAAAHRSHAAEKCELIERFIDPYARDLVDLFFAKTNICFPIFDEASFKYIYSNDRRRISPALLSNVYASALIYWESSPKLRESRRPDINFIWVLAYEALNSEAFLSPGTSTIMSIILNVCGRPSTAMICNGGMLGLAVALCNALGLNRDPSNWDISPLEKQIRIKIWWLVVMHDRWCSLAYGTPLQIHREQHDVPIPSTQEFSPTRTSASQVVASSTLISLVTLTEVLGRYLEHVYRLAKASPDLSATSDTDFELLLGQWVETLSDDIRQVVIRGTNLNAPGTANLRLAYLAVKLLLRRIQLDLGRNAPHVDSPYHMRTQRAAEDVVHFVLELGEPQCHGFWMSSNAFTLTSAASFLLRSAVRSRSSGADCTSLKMAREMIDTLRSHRTRFSWDIADNCLGNCGGLVDEIGEGNRLYSSPALPNLEAYPDVDMSVLDDLLSGFNDPIESEFM